MGDLIQTNETYKQCPEYASVRILEVPYHADRVYEYRIPNCFQGSLNRGSFVVVPYGTGNRRVVGIVVDLSDKSKYDPTRIKYADAIATEKLFLDEESLELCTFMKRRYLCTFGDAVKLLLPPGALSKLTESYTLTPEGERINEGDVSEAEYKLVCFLKENKKANKDVLNMNFPIIASSNISRLVEKDLAVRCIEINEPKEAYVGFVSLSKSREKIMNIINGKDGEIKLRSENHKRILSLMLEQKEEEITVAALCEEASVSPSMVKALIDKELLSLSRKQIKRDVAFISAMMSDIPEKKEIKLSESQSEAYDKLCSLYEAGKAAVSLLYGVTGSGKTSVMLSLIDRVLADGKQVIVLIPEIALTPQSFRIFASRYGNSIALVHSGLSQGERYDAYMRIKNGEASVIIGTRSAIFSPVQNLGLIIIDEEHEHTYKSDTNPRYHARDIAKFKCHKANALLVLASATPDIESYYNAECGRYTLVNLTERYGNAILPRVETVDMRKENRSASLSPFSEHLIKRMEEALLRKEQIIIFINRRGFNNYVVCSECGNAFKCPHCDVTLTYHVGKRDYSKGSLRCHICGYSVSDNIKCSECGSTRLLRFGYGTQRVEKEISDIFPNASVIRMDQDTIENKQTYFDLLNSFKEHKADILLGTSMITKGHDFPDVTLVGVLMADSALAIDDYRAGERTYDIITQVVGRAGRGDKPGIAVIQAMNPENEIIGLACKQDYPAFYKSEMKYREAANFPPFCDIVLIELISEHESALQRYCDVIKVIINDTKKNGYRDVPIVFYGPFEAPIYKTDEKYKMRIIFKCRLNADSRAFFAEILARHGASNFNPKPLMTLNASPSSL